jgi:hypothetical protein
MKYKIIEDHVIQALVDFLDDIQLDAAEQNDLVLLGFIQDTITDLINSEEVFDNEEEALNQLRGSKDKEILNEDYYKGDDEPITPKFDRDELKKLYKYFDNFLNELSDLNPDIKDGKSSKKKSKKEKDTEDKTEKRELSREEKFELFYMRRAIEREKKESLSLKEMLDELKIKNSKK